MDALRAIEIRPTVRYPIERFGHICKKSVNLIGSLADK